MCGAVLYVCEIPVWGSFQGGMRRCVCCVVQGRCGVWFPGVCGGLCGVEIGWVLGGVCCVLGFGGDVGGVCIVECSGGCMAHMGLFPVCLLFGCVCCHCVWCDVLFFGLMGVHLV